MTSSSSVSINTRTLFFLSVLFITVYFVVASSQGFFHLQHYFYLADSKTMMFGIPFQILLSYFWKIVLLFPGTVCGALALSKLSFRISIPEKFHSNTTVVVIIALAGVIIISCIHFLLNETELTDDENTYDFEAKTLLLGRVTNPPPPVPHSFNNTFIINDGRVWVGRYPLGHPLVIAGGMLLGSRYTLIVAMSLLMLWLVFLVAKELFQDNKVALLALCLGAISPFFYLVSSSRLSHPTSAFFLVLFTYLFVVERRTEQKPKKMILAFIAGLSLGFCFNVRPLTAVGFSLPFCVIAVSDLRNSWRRQILPVISFLIGFVIILYMTLWYNSVVTGNMLNFPHTYYSTLTSQMPETVGFGTYGHTLGQSLSNLAVSGVRMNFALFGFPVSLIFLGAAFFIRKEFGDKLLIGILSGLCVAYLFWYTPGVSDIGPIYYYEAILPLLLLSARGIQLLHQSFSRCISYGSAIIPNVLFLSVIISCWTFIPEKIGHINQLTKKVNEPYEVVESEGIHHAVVLIRSLPLAGWVFSYRNPSPSLNDDIIYCMYADSLSNQAILSYFHDREPYVLQYNKETSRVELLQFDRATNQYFMVRE